MKLTFWSTKTRKKIDDIKREWNTVIAFDGPGDSKNLLEIYNIYKKYLTEADDVDDLTWNDLEMDGIYTKMNHAFTFSGELALYRILRKPCYNIEELKERDQMIEAFIQDDQLRIQKQMELSYINKYKSLSIYECFHNLEQVPHISVIKNIVLPLLFWISLIICFFNSALGILLCICSFVMNSAGYYHDKRYIEPYLLTLSEIGRMMGAINSVQAESGIEVLDKYMRPLETCKKCYKRYRKYITMIAGGNNRVGNGMEILVDYFRLMTHADLICFNKFLNIMNEDYDLLLKMYETVGYIDALLSVSKFRHDINLERGETAYCKPQFQSGYQSEYSGSEGAYLAFDQVYYPLLKNPVKNSLETEKGILITGSNATGKSTFLRAVATNVLLAETIFTVCADRFSLSFLKVLTSMNIKDNIYGNDSYYMMEIKSLKRLLDQNDSKRPVLCCMDEILRGTNTVERIGAATEILQTLAAGNVLCIAASHDIELSYILEDVYQNYHFQEYVEDDRVYSDYKLYKDRSYTRNAIELLRCMGYSKAIVDHARRNVNQYLETGKWARVR